MAATAGLNNGGNSIHVSLAYSQTPPPPASHEIRGYAGKCADDPGNSAANGTKVQLWSCLNDASQQWSFSNGELKHGSMCMNDQD
ncbi:MAG TPA: RICIN domain-containing protein [Streptosporangiaceae bacterium]|nr:RICIN domain-containing protein [Streptosporangiaceae bacterium]